MFTYLLLVTKSSSVMPLPAILVPFSSHTLQVSLPSANRSGAVATMISQREGTLFMQVVVNKAAPLFTSCGRVEDVKAHNKTRRNILE